MDTQIVLSTINAKFIHSAVALRYLKANLQEFQQYAQIREFTLQERAADIVEKLILLKPSTIVFSCYIWNITLIDEVTTLVKSLYPNIIIILGGPEVSYPNDHPSVCDMVDHIICNEGEHALPQLLRDIQNGKEAPKIIAAPIIDLDTITLPFHLYTDADLAHRLIYVETSRGCAYGCEFCLSSLDNKVRYFPIQTVLDGLEALWQRGARQFKFIDRTIHLSKAKMILDFFAKRMCPELFVHFEIVPDSIGDKLITTLSQFPDGAIQLEAGVQTFNPTVSARIGRKQNMDKTEHNIRRLITETGVHVHSDLVIGLPGETIESLSNSFNRLLATGVHEIQIGILKKLRGAPICRHTKPFKMIYRTSPSYDILQNNCIEFMTMQRLKRFSRYFDLVSNNGNFKTTSPLLWKNGSPFHQFLHFSDWLFQQSQRTAGIALDRLAEYLFAYLVEQQGHCASVVANHLYHDFSSCGRRRFPKCVREHTTDILTKATVDDRTGLPERQKRHRK